MHEGKVVVDGTNWIFTTIDFGKYNEAVERLIKMNDSKKYKDIHKVLIDKDKIATFWQMFNIVLSKNFVQELAREDWLKNMLPTYKDLSEADLKAYEKMLKKETLYEIYVEKQFDIYASLVYNNYINTNLFKGVEDILSDEK